MDQSQREHTDSVFSPSLTDSPSLPPTPSLYNAPSDVLPKAAVTVVVVLRGMHDPFIFQSRRFDCRLLIIVVLVYQLGEVVGSATFWLSSLLFCDLNGLLGNFCCGIFGPFQEIRS